MGTTPQISIREKLHVQPPNYDSVHFELIQLPSQVNYFARLATNGWTEGKGHRALSLSVSLRSAMTNSAQCFDQHVTRGYY